MNVILTKLLKPSLFNIQVFISEKVSDERGDTPNNCWFRGKDKGKHTNSGKSGTSAHYANYTPVEDFHYGDDTTEPADAYQADKDPVDTEILDDVDDEENDTFSSYVALDDVTILEAAELDEISLLADTRDNELDPDVSAQLVQANVQAYLSFGQDKGEGKGKGKSKGRYPVRMSHFVIGRSSTTIERTASEN